MSSIGCTQSCSVDPSSFHVGSTMLQIQSVSGEVLDTIDLARFLEELGSESFPVRVLKQRLSSLCGMPRFRQRLVFLDGAAVDDESTLRPGEAQLVLLNFSSATDAQIKELQHVADKGLISDVENILQRPQDPDLGHPAPLWVASARGHVETVRLLLEAGADKNKAEQDGTTPLFVASQQGQLEVARLLLESEADQDKARNDDIGPLFIAAQQGHVEVARILLAAEADKNKAAGTGAITPLYSAAYEGQLEVARLLLEAKADKDKAVDNGDTPLCAAAYRGQLEVARLLLEAKADADKANHSGATPLSLAVERGHFELVHFLRPTTKTESSSRTFCFPCLRMTGKVANLANAMPQATQPHPSSNAS